ncbi:hypothetical protein TruAng_003852 [Truncatella angustata]|nr:hypothetical protein TruAng_003852 [Truncatella angustata]
MEASTESDIGVSRVSGYYGPGAISAWWLLTIATLISSFYGEMVAPGVRRPPSIWNLFNIDPGVLASTGYPCVASFDLLYNLKAYTSDQHNVALYCAPLLVVMEAQLAMVLLISAVLGRGSLQDGRLRFTDLTLVLMFLLYFCIVHHVTVLVCIDKVLIFARNSIVPLGPWAWDEGASYVSECERNVDNYIKRLIYPDRTDSSGDYRPGDPRASNYEGSELIMWVFSIFCVLGIVFIVIGHSKGSFAVGQTRYDGCLGALALLLGVSLAWMFVWTIFAPLMLNILVLCESIVLRLLFMGIGTVFIPQSTASFLDLDQMAAFIVGGLIPLVMSAAPIAKRILERYRSSRSQLAALDNEEATV